MLGAGLGASVRPSRRQGEARRARSRGVHTQRAVGLWRGLPPEERGDGGGTAARLAQPPGEMRGESQGRRVCGRFLKLGCPSEGSWGRADLGAQR